MSLKTKILFSMIWIGITLVALGIISRNINLPHRHVYFNWDEAYYAAPALELVESGTRVNSKSMPAGFYEKGNANVGYPSILPFFQYTTIKYLGYNRLAWRLPGLVLFCLGSGILLILWWQMGLGVLHGTGLMASYLLSPWMYLAATTARAEMVSVFFILLACLAVWLLRGRVWLGVLVSGFLAGVASYNHPTFLGAACVPFLFALKITNVPWKVKELWLAAIYYGGGAFLAVGCLFSVLALPYFDQWHEQFFQSLSDPNNFLYGNRGRGWLGEALLLKDRFSTYGMGYANWYLLVLLFFPFFLRATIISLLAAIWLCATMFYLHFNTLVSLQYCIPFAAGIPVLLLLCGESRFNFLRKPEVYWVLLALVAIQVPWNAWRATQTNEFSIQFATREREIFDQLQSIKDAKAIGGGDEAIFPVLANGYRFFYMKPKWGFGPKQMKRFFDLSEKQADYFVPSEGPLTRNKPNVF